MKNDKPASISEISDFSLSDSDIKYTRGVKDIKSLKLLISEIGGGRYYLINCSGRRKKAELISKEQFDKIEFTESLLSISETKHLFLEMFTFDDIPSPLKYADKNKKDYIKDVVFLKGDFYYRKAIIDILIDSELSDLSGKMEKI